MRNRSFARILVLMLSLIFVVGLSACQSANPAPTASSAASSAVASVAPTATATAVPTAKPPVTLKFYSFNPDRSTGEGLGEQMVIDDYMKANPNVTIVVEALAGDAATQKLNAYLAANNLPDVIRIFGIKSVMGPYVAGNYLQELNPADYEKDNFLPGSMQAYTYNGKLYGLPKNTDCMVLYYNKALFDKCNVKVPITFNELLDAGKVFNANGITPMVMDGTDTWMLPILYQQLALDYGGNQQTIYDAVAQNTSFAKDPVLTQAADMCKQLVDNNMFQQGYSTTDYGTARNYFAQGKAAMWYMGSWESGMGNDKTLPSDFVSNVHCVPFPVSDKGKATDLIAWNGGGYGVAANSKVKDEALKFLAFMFQPDELTKISWQVAGSIPAQKWDAYMTGNETEVQKEIVSILSSATSTSATVMEDTQTPDFKTASTDIFASLFAGIKTPAETLSAMDDAVSKLPKQ